MERIDTEDTWIEASTIHVEAVHPIVNTLATTPLADDSEFMLKISDRFAIDDELRQSIIGIDISKDGSII